MKQINEVIDEEQVLTTNLKQTSLYFVDAVSQKDYESASLEMEELQFLLTRLKDLKLKRERREMLVGLVSDMKQRGMNIDFAGSSSLFKYGAKNVGESNKKISEIHKKRQQA
jgi:GH35 family endo-1,4-beta-xylanase